MPRAPSALVAQERQDKFLANYAKTGIMKVAASSVGVVTSTVGRWRKDSEEFDLAVQEAFRAWLGSMEEEAFSRAKGKLVPVYFQGVKVGTKPEYSDRLMELILKAKMPEVYGDKQTVDLNIAGGVLLLPPQADKNEWLKRHNSVEADYRVEE